ncbi:hypothetical protein CMQ_3877 [Grosmannia clavigera kw1407]|uniref:DUF7702 domain-containing protein n=1 Tax=Grosmannia clavigera (strain kw1407 / UAMH 11150) TaxID=655863 RepID=F0XAC7_GROCL|nr:uncharacterized protein CMQ_3877 [Grosmannia clavigera kw1407]EFX05808.1 hypothetical protein CMQ_3877 [Grosmannia clavigera kw1407]
MALSELNKIPIVQICFYVPSLFIAVLLSWRHGFGRSSGWLYLVIFSLTRIMGGAFELATIHDRDNVSLFVGAQTLQSIGLSPLLLTMLGLMTRVYLSLAEQRRPAMPNLRSLHVTQVLVVVGLILSIVGGTKMGSQIGDAVSKGGPLTYTVSGETKGGVGCMIGGFVLLLLSGLLLATRVGDVPAGEKRLLAAIAVAVPFVFVRLLYAILAAFDTADANFRIYNSGPHYAKYLLVMCTIMEIVAVVVFEAVGLSLVYVSRRQRVSQQAAMSDSSQTHTLATYPDSSYQASGFQLQKQPV